MLLSKLQDPHGEHTDIDNCFNPEHPSALYHFLIDNGMKLSAEAFNRKDLPDGTTTQQKYLFRDLVHDNITYKFIAIQGTTTKADWALDGKHKFQDPDCYIPRVPELEAKSKAITTRTGTDNRIHVIKAVKERLENDIEVHGHIFDQYRREMMTDPSVRIVVTGHSLGGALAQLISEIYGFTFCITFAAPRFFGNVITYPSVVHSVVFGIERDLFHSIPDYRKFNHLSQIVMLNDQGSIIFREKMHKPFREYYDELQIILHDYIVRDSKRHATKLYLEVIGKYLKKYSSFSSRCGNCGGILTTNEIHPRTRRNTPHPRDLPDIPYNFDYTRDILPPRTDYERQLHSRRSEPLMDPDYRHVSAPPRRQQSEEEEYVRNAWRLVPFQP